MDIICEKGPFSSPYLAPTRRPIDTGMDIVRVPRSVGLWLYFIRS